MRSAALLLPLSLLACRSTEPTAPIPDLAPLFGERLHGFTPLTPVLRGDGDELSGASYDADGRLALPAGAVFTSQLLRWPRPFDELLLSWNASVPAGAGLVVEVQVESAERQERSPWLYIGGWGLAPTAMAATEFDGGRVEVDVLRCERPFDAFRTRLRAVGAESVGAESVGAESVGAESVGAGGIVVHSTSACLTARADLEHLAPGPWPAEPGAALAVPALSQRQVAAELAPRICSPTSVAMVLAHNGVEVPLEVLAQEIYDPEHDLYGNWPRAVQAAFARGVPGALVRLSSWSSVEHFLNAGVPLVISVKAEEGELSGAPYPRTSGHLLVVTGLEPGGRVLVNDPAAPTPEEVPRSYLAEDLERCWMRRGGVAYAIGPRPER